METALKNALAMELIGVATKVGRHMVADMADQAARILSERNDLHGAATLQEFAFVLRKDVDESEALEERDD